MSRKEHETTMHGRKRHTYTIEHQNGKGVLSMRYGISYLFHLRSTTMYSHQRRIKANTTEGKKKEEETHKKQEREHRLKKRNRKKTPRLERTGLS